MGIFKNDGWVTTALLVLGGLGTVSAILSWLSKDLTVVLAFTAGAGWTLSIPILIMLYERNREMKDLREKISKLEESELANTTFFQRDLEELRHIERLNAETLNVFATRAFGVPKTTARRKAAPLIPPENHDEEE